MNLAQELAKISDQANIERDNEYKKLANEVFDDLICELKFRAAEGKRKYRLNGYATKQFSYDCYMNGSVKDHEIFCRLLELLRTNGFTVKTAENMVEW